MMKKKDYKTIFSNLGLNKKNNTSFDIKEIKNSNKTASSLQLVSEIKKSNDDELIENNYDSEKLFELQHIYLWYKKFNKITNVIFEDLNLTIYKNQIVAIVGKNGAGKTTLFELITQIRKANRGRVVFFEKEASQNPTKYISMQTQDFVFPSGLTVKDIVEFILELQQINIEDNLDEFKEMLKIFQLDALWNEKASKLSGGQQQRLNLFISLLNHPKILLLDEYATGLDLKSKEDIEKFIMNYIKVHGTTLIFISHELGGLSQMATRYIIIENKNIVVDLPINKVNKMFGNVTNLIKYYIS